VPPDRPLPPWPATPPAVDGVVLRAFTPDDLPMALDLATDPYVTLVGSLPSHATEEQALDWIRRNRGRWADGVGFSFAVAEAATGRAVGQLGLWLADLAEGRGQIGYFVMPSARGRGFAAAALKAATAFAWTIPRLQRVELHIEPWNRASLRTAERAGYTREGLLRAHREIAGQRRDVVLYAAVRPG
jgi:RimJ/RimL family protein N-acetyltransferase